MNQRQIGQVDVSAAHRVPGIARILLGAMVAFAAGAAPASAQAQTTTAVCGPSVKAEVAAALAQAVTDADRLVLEKDLYAKYQYCAKDVLPVGDTFPVAVRECSGKLAYLGSTYYEEMPCCGYDPQRRQFACPVKIKQRYGFGPAPLPGSREYVLHCVATPAGIFLPVGYDSVHLADEMYGISPPWQFAVIAAANDKLGLVYPMSGQTRIARSILSWNFQPTDCNYQPIWGNVIDYPIRLDQ